MQPCRLVVHVFVMAVVGVGLPSVLTNESPLNGAQITCVFNVSATCTFTTHMHL